MRWVYGLALGALLGLVWVAVAPPTPKAAAGAPEAVTDQPEKSEGQTPRTAAAAPAAGRTSPSPVRASPRGSRAGKPSRKPAGGPPRAVQGSAAPAAPAAQRRVIQELRGNTLVQVVYVKVNGVWRREGVRLPDMPAVVGQPDSAARGSGLPAEPAARTVSSSRAAAPAHTSAANPGAAALPAGGQPTVLQFGETNFKHEALRSPLPVVVVFHAPWCPACRRLSPAIDEAAAAFSGRLRFGRVDCDAQPTLAQEYKIEAIPTVLLLRSGRVVQRLTGPDPATFRAAVAAFASR